MQFLACDRGVRIPRSSGERSEPVIDLGSHRELFIDRYLIDRLTNARLELARLRDEGAVLAFDRPWEGAFCGYGTVIQETGRFRLYYRGLPSDGKDGGSDECTCYAESKDGIHWTKPSLGLFEKNGSRDNNIILSNAAPVTHNFCPFRDARPGVSASERYKGIRRHPGKRADRLCIERRHSLEETSRRTGFPRREERIRFGKRLVLVGARALLRPLLPSLSRQTIGRSHDVVRFCPLVEAGCDDLQRYGDGGPFAASLHEPDAAVFSHSPDLHRDGGSIHAGPQSRVRRRGEAAPRPPHVFWRHIRCGAADIPRREPL